MEIPQIPEGANVVGVGIDQIEVSRIRDSVKRHGNTFLNKVFTSEEQNSCVDRADPAPCLAARFAVKEAVSKALGTGIGKEFGWLDVEVIKEKNGKPKIIIADTVKGKGVSLMEHQPNWHYWQGMTEEQIQTTRQELEII